jgi:hypothetical protein
MPVDRFQMVVAHAYRRVPLVESQNCTQEEGAGGRRDRGRRDKRKAGQTG